MNRETSFNNLVLRTPLKSLSDQETVITKEWVDLLINDKEFLKGLYLASPELYSQISKIERLDSKEFDKIKNTIYKYWKRACTRPTPYATFAATEVIQISKSTSKLIVKESELIERYRLDMNFLSHIIDLIHHNKNHYFKIPFIPNNSIYQFGNLYRYIDFYKKNGLKHFELASLNFDKYLETILKICKNGANRKEIISQFLNQHSDISEQEVAEYIDELIEQNFIISGFELNITGEDPLAAIIKKFEDNQITEEFFKICKDRIDLLNKIDTDISDLIRNEKHILNHVRELDKGLNWNIFQVDSFRKNSSNNLNKSLIEKTLFQISQLDRFTISSHAQDLDIFKENFIDKYDLEEVPINIVLDADVGIGYAGSSKNNFGISPILDGLPIARGPSHTSPTYDILFPFVAKKMEGYLKNQKNEIEIYESDLIGLSKNNSNRSNIRSSYILGSYIKKKDQPFNENNFLFDFTGTGGPSASNLLGRFAYWDKDIEELCQDIINKEEEKVDAIFAEIVHLPQSRAGNILLRPTLRTYEIPYLGKSGINNQFQISLEDILVGVRNNRIYLKHRKLNKEIIPRLSAAHDFHTNSLPLYKFLCDLQSQDSYSEIQWNWGVFENWSHLPQVRYKNIILKKASWRVYINQFDLKLDKGQQLNFLTNYRKENNIPKSIILKLLDGDMVLDLEKTIDVDIFINYLNKNRTLIIEENVMLPENCIVHDESGKPYSHEVIIPWNRTYTPIHTFKFKNDIVDNDTNLNNIKLKRSFLPNSEWLYYKIYLGSLSGEKFLNQSIFPFIEKGRLDNLFNKFFFVRYLDRGGVHLRIRFYNKDINKHILLNSLFFKHTSTFFQSNNISKISIETYIRELERYNPMIIEEIESIFYHDSICVLKINNLLSQVENSNKYRIILALRGIDILLKDFKIPLKNKFQIAKILNESYIEEYGGSKELKISLGDKYRKWQNDIFSHLNEQLDEENGINEAITIFYERSTNIKDIINQIECKIDLSFSEPLITDIIHMFINRLFIFKQRQYELVLYHFLQKYYRSQMFIKDGKK